MPDLLRSLRPRTVKAALAAATIFAVTAGCAKDSAAAAPGHEAQAEQASQVQADTPYKITTATVGECKAGTECTATIRIEALGEFHVNDTYPFKFTASAPGTEFHGGSGNVFGPESFARQGNKVGVMTVKFKPSAKGKLAITGTYKICICTDKICQPTSTNVTIDVDVK